MAEFCFQKTGTNFWESVKRYGELEDVMRATFISDEVKKEVYEKIMKDFTKAHPDITVKFRAVLKPGSKTCVPGAWTQRRVGYGYDLGLVALWLDL